MLYLFTGESWEKLEKFEKYEIILIRTENNNLIFFNFTPQNDMKTPRCQNGYHV